MSVVSDEAAGRPPNGLLGAVRETERAAYGPQDRAAKPPQWKVVTVGLVLAVLFLIGVSTVAPATMVGTAALGLALGFTLFHSRFGFTSGWRQLVAVGQGAAIRAHMLMLGTAAVLFAVILSSGFALAGEPRGLSAPVGIGLVVGSFLFGVGMQVGGSCASGTLFAVGSGQSAIVLTLFGFIVGSMFAVFTHSFWTQTVPQGPTVDLAQSLGYPGALALTLVVLAAITVVTWVVARRRTPPPVERPPSARGIARVLRGSWPMWAGAIVLAVLNAAVLFVSAAPWGVTSAFALWGSKFLQLLGFDMASLAYWQVPANARSLAGPVLADRISNLDVGIMIGALVASAVGGAFVLHKRIPWKLALGAVLGGIAMGYGARLAGGCNIGAYFSGIASFSLHGWIWAVVALGGTWVGLRLRPLFGLTNPKPADSLC
ncbi:MULTISPECIES: YeeE/YedE family protein [unclassified Pseudonocardia]|uniref:YeeE/YedE family protein n=1 Tax=unclassified Pseudonocardia TaxID=2619320 RepID=UPI0001FFE8A9|nr:MULTISPECIES: YeeE/YedE family protein [unclassified Pseudonocardia]ALE74575.1 membrane protein [Pseudonocardia sp. EC080625-04]ALL77996.1 membrane protein [Pseudonocardia sp. EC080610-09]ALL80910.1 membrane protein [Pseudonocardia sp. EC080619-01]OLM17080.1 membrane protein [Pseudonocardia sp. Ae707_Ps1]